MPAGANDVVATVDGREITVSTASAACTCSRCRRTAISSAATWTNGCSSSSASTSASSSRWSRKKRRSPRRRSWASRPATRKSSPASSSLPAFQENGQFIGETRYRQVLNMQNPPLRADEFEEQVRRGITMEKLQGALTDWITVTEPEVDAEFRRRNEKVKLSVVNFAADKFREATHGHRRGSLGLVRLAQGRLQDSREAQDQVRAPRHAGDPRAAPRSPLKTCSVSTRRTSQQYSTPEQVRASHILFKTEGKDEAEVRKQAESRPQTSQGRGGLRQARE